jgi:hypothetical protein
MTAPTPADLAARLRNGDWNLRAPQEMADMIADWLDQLAAATREPPAPAVPEEPDEHIAILGSLKERALLKIVAVPQGQSLDFDPGPGATRKWLHPHLGREWHLIEFIPRRELEAVAWWTAGRAVAAAPEASAQPATPKERKPLTEKQVNALIHAKHFDPTYELRESDEVCLRWYRLGLRDGEAAHGIGEQPKGNK